MIRIISLFVLLLLMSCSKTVTEPETEMNKQQGTDETLVNLTITATTTPATASMEGNIVSSVRCVGPNLCYKFKTFEVKETAAREFEIRAKGTFPSGENVVCAQAIYSVDTTVSIKPTTTGQYTLRFYNGTTLFKTDVVQVN